MRLHIIDIGISVTYPLAASMPLKINRYDRLSETTD